MPEITQTVADTDPAVAASSGPMEQLAGKYMTFKLAEEEYGLEILKVREIIGLMHITSVPRTKELVRGVINLRGKVIPVLDLRLRFAMPTIKPTEQTVIIVVQYEQNGQETTTGVLVDEVLEVINIGPGQIEPPPNFGANAKDTDFILGIGENDDRVIFLLDIGRALSCGDEDDPATDAEVTLQ